MDYIYSVVILVGLSIILASSFNLSIGRLAGEDSARLCATS